ncbi:MAG: serine/threonine protein kinase [Desulfobacteraceae bacterium]|nr:serine/threonine protein kinase [Desulfobacteraceae bacterium]MBC2754338.1 serine/threonine protein kinase [Desulfobacteraceae bacterium]
MSGIKSIDKLKSVLADKYEIVGLIASGGMGEIYLGVHRVLGKKRAIKIIHQEVEKEKDIRKRFMQEARLAASIDHPGIIQIMDFGSHDSFDYLIMPYIEGVTLQDKMDDGVMKWEDSIDLMISMVEAISHAHKKNVIHRDIKPANYMIDSNGQVILTDFGISKNLTDATLTAANTVLGSPKFMSPEQITGKKVDKRSDLYSLGLVFYQMLTGINPFDADEITSVMYKQVHEVPEHPSALNSNIPKKVGDILSRLLEKKPENRYPDADMLLMDLHQLKHPETFDSGGKTVLQVPHQAQDRPQDRLQDTYQDGPKSRLRDMATRIISPLQRKEIKIREKTDAKPVSQELSEQKTPEKGKANKIKFFIVFGILFFSLLGLITIFSLDFLKNINKEQAGVAHQPPQTEKPVFTEEPFVEKKPEDTRKPPEIQIRTELPVKISDIRIDPQIIIETLEKDKFAVKTIHIYNDGEAKLSEINIITESDGPFDFLGPVNKSSFDVDAGGVEYFTCPVNSANTTPGEVKTGRIKIYSNDPDENPKIVEVRLTVKEISISQSKDKITRLAKPSKPLVAIRPKNIRESAFLKNYANLNGRQVTGQDINKFLKLNIGFAYGKTVDQQLIALMKKFLSGLSYVQLLESDPCDILISYNKDASGGKFVVKSNFYDCGLNCPEMKIKNKTRLPLEQLEAMIKRYYCYHALIGLSVINSTLRGAHIDLELPGKTDNILFIDDEVKLCMTPELAADCMLLDINIAGIYKLFPIFENQKMQQVKGETQCSIDIKVSLPTGYEMVVALGVKNEKLISKYRNRFNPENPIILWSFSNESENNAMVFCEELFLNLINEPFERWCINSRFIQIMH